MKIFRNSDREIIECSFFIMMKMAHSFYYIIYIEEAENLAEIVGTMVRQRKFLGISQRELASMCDMPQSSVARIESLRTSPNIETLLKLFEPLGLTLTVSMKK